VGLDLERLYPGDPFYSAAPVQECLRRVLLVYALRFPSLAYRQGMHEVAAVLFSVVYKDACGSRPVTELVVPGLDASVGDAGVCSERYVEHDTYSLFQSVMGVPTDDVAALDEMTHLARGGGLCLCRYYQDAPPAPPSRKAPVHDALTRIWATLAAVDAQLHAHLSDTGVQPQLFLLRWLRLLFGREFHTDDVVALWDVLLEHNGADLTEAMAVAMILFLRAQLLAAPDFAAQLRRLQKFPPVEDINVLSQRARALLPALHAVAIQSAAAKALSGGDDDAAPPQSEPAHSKPHGHSKAAGAAAAATQPARGPPPPSYSSVMSPSSTGGFPIARFPVPPSLSSMVCEPVPSAVLRPAAAAAARVSRAVADQMETDAQRLAHLADNFRTLNTTASAGVHNAMGQLQTDLNAALDTLKDSTRTAVAVTGSPVLLTAYDSLAAKGTPRGASAAHDGGIGSPPTSPTKPAKAGSPPAAPAPAPALMLRHSGSSASLSGREDEDGGAMAMAKAPGGGSEAALLDAPIGSLEGLLSRMRTRWGDPLSSSAIDPAAAAADDAATLARALAQLRAAQTRLAATAD
jgi:hypothetical protein